MSCPSFPGKWLSCSNHEISRWIRTVGQPTKGGRRLALKHGWVFPPEGGEDEEMKETASCGYSQPSHPCSMVVLQWLEFWYGGWFLKEEKQKLPALLRSRLESSKMWLIPHSLGQSNDKDSLNSRGEDKSPTLDRAVCTCNKGRNWIWPPLRLLATSIIL